MPRTALQYHTLLGRWAKQGIIAVLLALVLGPGLASAAGIRGVMLTIPTRECFSGSIWVRFQDAIRTPEVTVLPVGVFDSTAWKVLVWNNNNKDYFPPSIATDELLPKFNTAGWVYEVGLLNSGGSTRMRFTYSLSAVLSVPGTNEVVEVGLVTQEQGLMAGGSPDVSAVFHGLSATEVPASGEVALAGSFVADIDDFFQWGFVARAGITDSGGTNLATNFSHRSINLSFVQVSTSSRPCGLRH